MTSSAIDASASDRSIGGASGSGPPMKRPYRALRSSAIDRLPLPRRLRQLPRQVETFERQFERGRPLARRPRIEPIGDRVVEARLRELRQLREQLLSGDPLAGHERAIAIEGGHQGPEVEAGEPLPRRLRRGDPEAVVEDVPLAALLAGLELHPAPQHAADGE